MKTPGQELFERSADAAACSWRALTPDTRNSWEREAYHKTIAARLAAAEQMAQALKRAKAALGHGLPGSIYATTRVEIDGALAEWEAAK